MMAAVAKTMTMKTRTVTTTTTTTTTATMTVMTMMATTLHKRVRLGLIVLKNALLKVSLHLRLALRQKLTIDLKTKLT